MPSKNDLGEKISKSSFTRKMSRQSSRPSQSPKEVTYSNIRVLTGSEQGSLRPEVKEFYRSDKGGFSDLDQNSSRKGTRDHHWQPRLDPSQWPSTAFLWLWFGAGMEGFAQEMKGG
jgi:hypothetical protein